MTGRETHSIPPSLLQFITKASILETPNLGTLHPKARASPSTTPEHAESPDPPVCKVAELD